jgi:hypothetical protein
MEMKKWTWFIGSCILATGILLKLGVPLVPLVAGIAGAAFLTWKMQRSA